MEEVTFGVTQEYRLEPLFVWQGDSSGWFLDPLNKSSPVFRLHSDELHAHSLLELGPLYNGPRPYLSGRYIEEQLDERSERSRLSSSNEHATQAEILQMGHEPLVTRLPSQNCAIGRIDPGVATKIVHFRAV